MAGRTAVVAGTATAVSGRVARRQQGRWAEQEQQQAPAPAPAAAPVPQPDPMARLKELGELHDSAVLTDEEFTAAKAKILSAVTRIWWLSGAGCAPVQFAPAGSRERLSDARAGRARLAGAVR